MLTNIALAVVAVMIGFPETSVGAALRRWLVEAPARAMSRVSPGRVAFYAALAVAGLVMVLLFEVEGLRLFAMMLPETLVWFAAFDVSVFVDALLIGAAVSGANGLRVVRQRLRIATTGIRLAVRRLAARAPRPPRSAGVRKRPAADPDAAYYFAPYRAFSIA